MLALGANFLGLNVMRDLREELDPIWRAATHLAREVVGAPILMFTAARSGEGVTSMAASFACMAARRSDKPVWLVDLDLRGNPLHSGFQNGFARDVGRPKRAYDASLRQPPIYKITPHDEAARQEKMLTAHALEGLPVLVTRFRNERLKPGQRVALQLSPEWWQTLRTLAGWVVIDASSVLDASAALTMASIADGIVLVVAADRTTPPEIEHARQALEARQGRMLGAVMNQMQRDARVAERFST